TNEHKAALRLLGLIPLAGKVVVGDALFCQRDLAGQVVDGGGDSLFTVKDNQPGLATDVAAGFGFEAAARALAAAFSPPSDPRRRRSGWRRRWTRGTAGARGGRCGRPRS